MVQRVSLTPAYARWFRGISENVYFFSEVERESHLGEIRERCCVVTDKAMLLCTPKGIINREISLDKITEIVIGGDGKKVLVRVPSEYDVVLVFPSALVVLDSLSSALNDLAVIPSRILGIDKEIGGLATPIQKRTTPASPLRSSLRNRGLVSPPELAKSVDFHSDSSSEDGDANSESVLRNTNVVSHHNRSLSSSSTSTQGEDFKKSTSLYTFRHSVSQYDDVSDGDTSTGSGPHVSFAHNSNSFGDVFETVDPFQSTSTQTESLSVTCPGCCGIKEYGCIEGCPSMWYPFQKPSISGIAPIIGFEPSGGLKLSNYNTSAAYPKGGRSSVFAVVSTSLFSDYIMFEVRIEVSSSGSSRCSIGVQISAEERIELRSDGSLIVDGNRVAKAHLSRGFQRGDLLTIRIDKSVTKTVRFSQFRPHEAIQSPPFEYNISTIYLASPMRPFAKLCSHGDAVHINRFISLRAAPSVTALSAGLALLVNVIMCVSSGEDRSKSALKSKNAQLVKENEHLKSVLGEVLVKSKQAERENSELRAENNLIQREHNDLIAQLADLHPDVPKTGVQSVELHSTVQSLKKTIRDLNESNLTLREKNILLDNELTGLSSRVFSAVGIEFRTDVSTAVDNIVSQNSELQTELRNIKNYLNNSVGTINVLNAIQQLADENFEFKKTLSDLSELTHQTTSHPLDIRKAVEDLVVDNNSLKNTISKLAQEFHISQTASTDFQEIPNLISDQCNLLRMVQSDHTELLSNLTNKLGVDGVEPSTEMLLKQISQLLQQNEESAEQLQLQQQISSLRNEVARYKENEISLKQEIDTQQVSKSEFHSQTSLLNQTTSELYASNSKLLDEMLELQGEKAALEVKEKRQRKFISELEKSRESDAKEREKFETKIAELEKNEDQVNEDLMLLGLTLEFRDKANPISPPPPKEKTVASTVDCGSTFLNAVRSLLESLVQSSSVRSPTSPSADFILSTSPDLAPLRPVVVLLQSALSHCKKRKVLKNSFRSILESLLAGGDLNNTFDKSPGLSELLPVCEKIALLTAGSSHSQSEPSVGRIKELLTSIQSKDKFFKENPKYSSLQPIVNNFCSRETSVEDIKQLLLSIQNDDQFFCKHPNFASLQKVISEFHRKGELSVSEVKQLLLSIQRDGSFFDQNPKFSPLRSILLQGFDFPRSNSEGSLGGDSQKSSTQSEKSLLIEIRELLNSLVMWEEGDGETVSISNKTLLPLQGAFHRALNHILNLKRLATTSRSQQSLLVAGIISMLASGEYQAAQSLIIQHAIPVPTSLARMMSRRFSSAAVLTLEKGKQMLLLQKCWYSLRIFTHNR